MNLAVNGTFDLFFLLTIVERGLLELSLPGDGVTLAPPDCVPAHLRDDSFTGHPVIIMAGIQRKFSLIDTDEKCSSGRMGLLPFSLGRMKYLEVASMVPYVRLGVSDEELLFVKCLYLNSFLPVYIGKKLGLNKKLANIMIDELSSSRLKSILVEVNDEICFSIGSPIACADRLERPASEINGFSSIAGMLASRVVMFKGGKYRLASPKFDSSKSSAAPISIICENCCSDLCPEIGEKVIGAEWDGRTGAMWISNLQWNYPLALPEIVNSKS